MENGHELRAPSAGSRTPTDKHAMSNRANNSKYNMC